MIIEVETKGELDKAIEGTNQEKRSGAYSCALKAINQGVPTFVAIADENIDNDVNKILEKIEEGEKDES